MRLSPPTLVFGAVCFAAGIFLQHRWPLGRLRAALGDMPEPVPLRLEDITRLPHHRRLVIVVSGQSNAANYVDERRSAGPGVFIFHRGKLFPAVDPLPGGDGNGGSIWSRLGARLAVAGKFDAVIFAVAAQGSSTAEEWAPGGSLHKRFFSTLVDLRDAGLSPQLLLWQQGETEAWSSIESGRSYLANISALVRSTREFSPETRVLVSQSTWRQDTTLNAQIGHSQRLATQLPGVAAGPNFDLLGATYRRDGVHFNARGADEAAVLWFEAIARLLPELGAVATGP